MAAAVLALALVLGGPQAVAAHSAGIAAQFQLGFSAAGTLLGVLELLLRAAGTLLGVLELLLRAAGTLLGVLELLLRVSELLLRAACTLLGFLGVGMQGTQEQEIGERHNCGVS